MTTIKLMYRTIIIDKHGKVIKRSPLKHSKSFLIQFLQYIESISAHTYSTNPTAAVAIKAVNGTTYNFALNSGAANLYFAKLAIAGIDTYGIVCGLGTNAAANTDNSLQTQVKTGTATNQMSYSAMSYLTTAANGTNIDLLWSRTFINTSGGDVAVKEIGMYVSGYDTATFQRFICIIRDLSTNTVANGNSLVIQYIYRTTV